MPLDAVLLQRTQTGDLFAFPAAWPCSPLSCLLHISCVSSRMQLCLLPLLVAIGKALVSKSQITQDFIPSAVPHAIRSPYYNAWVISIDQGENWPRFWTNRVSTSTLSTFTRCEPILTIRQNLGWSGLVRINGVTWEWLGGQGTGADGIKVPALTDLKITPTRTIYTQQAGDVRLTIIYLNPTEVGSLMWVPGVEALLLDRDEYRGLRSKGCEQRLRIYGKWYGRFRLNVLRFLHLATMMFTLSCERIALAY